VFTASDNPERRTLLTWWVLYGIFIWVALGSALSVLRLWWMRRPVAHLRGAFEDCESYKDLKTVYRFKDTRQVEMLARAMRKWDEEGVPDPQAVAFGEFILKVRFFLAGGMGGGLVGLSSSSAGCPA